MDKYRYLLEIEKIKKLNKNVPESNAKFDVCFKIFNLLKKVAEDIL